MKTQNTTIQPEKETLLKAIALITVLTIAAFAAFVIMVHPGNIS